MVHECGPDTLVTDPETGYWWCQCGANGQHG